VSALVRGDTYYVATGSYAGRDFNTAASGSAVITIKGATGADHGTSTGWTSTFSVNQADGGSQANWTYSAGNGPFGFSTSYWVWDGSVGPGAFGSGGNVSANYGFNVQFTGSCATGSNWAMEVPANHGSVSNVTNITFSHVAIVQCGFASNTFQTCWTLGDGASSGISAITISYAYCSGANNMINSTKVSNVTLDHVYTDKQWTASANHGEQIAVSGGGTTNWTISNNYLDNCQGTACFSVIVSGAIDGWKIYGNIFNQACDAATCGTPAGQTDNGIIASADNTTYVANISVYNNTFVNSGGTTIFACESGDTTACNSAINNTFENNLFWNSATAFVRGTITNDYNAYCTQSGSAPSETHGQTGCGDLFVASGSKNFHLASNTSAGLTLGAPYTIDPDGILRGVSAAWSRGAFQVVP
jgi:hypothetical protein